MTTGNLSHEGLRVCSFLVRNCREGPLSPHCDKYNPEKNEQHTRKLHVAQALAEEEVSQHDRDGRVERSKNRANRDEAKVDRVAEREESS
jgi:hypothetical protein